MPSPRSDLFPRRGAARCALLARREILVGVAAGAAGVLLSGCASRPLSASSRGQPPRDLVRELAGPIELWSCFDLPADDTRARELSGIAWDADEGVLWAVQDDSPQIVELVPDRDLRSWSFGKSIAIEVDEPVDLEGLVVVPGGFIVCSEEGPRVIEVDRSGRYRRDLTLPPRFREARTNKSLESLTASPTGRYLFTTSEVALRHDGGKATAHAGTRLRILRLDPNGGSISEHAYETDPVPFAGGDWGVSDLAALGDDDLLVLERGWAKGHGNTARVYHVSLEARASCQEVSQLSPRTPTLAKRLIVDLGKIAAAGRVPPAKQPQANALLDNYEGLTIGPPLRDGRRTLLVVSDDNRHPDQFARVLVLAFA